MPVTDRAGLQAWVDALNSWKIDEVAAWQRQPQWSSATDRSDLMRSDRGGNSLINYVVPGTGPTVVLSRHLLPDGVHYAMSTDLAARLLGCGVQRVVVGTCVICCILILNIPFL